MSSASSLPWRLTWGTGVAATAILLLAAAVGVLLPGRPAATWLAAEIVAHVQAEPAAVAGTAEVPVAHLIEAVERGGGRLLGALGKVTHVGQCPMPGGIGEHLVVETAHGKVTLVLMPGQSLGARAQITRDGLTGVVLPAGSGSAGIVAGSTDGLQEVEDAVRRHIVWR